jgi:hypothetical protein
MNRLEQASSKIVTPNIRHRWFFLWNVRRRFLLNLPTSPAMHNTLRAICFRGNGEHMKTG